MTNTERLEEIAAQPEWKKQVWRDLGGDYALILHCIAVIAERDAEIARFTLHEVEP